MKSLRSTPCLASIYNKKCTRDEISVILQHFNTVIVLCAKELEEAISSLKMLELLETSYWTISAVILLVVVTLLPVYRYYFKFAVYMLLVFCSIIPTLPLCIFRPRDVRNTWPFARAVTAVTALLGISWEIHGAEHLSKDFACIVVCNHQSMLDIAAVCTLWPLMKHCAVIVKRSLLYIPIFGTVGWLCGSVFIDRQKVGESRNLISTSAKAIKYSKTKLWIFPEGTRHKGASLAPFKKGAFYVALENKLPIVPVVISPYSFIDDDNKVFNSGRMVIKVLPPIKTDDYQLTDVTRLSEMVQTVMTKEFQDMNACCKP